MIKEAFRNGWQKFKENWKLLIGAQVTAFLISAVFNLVSENVPADLWFVALVVYLATVVLGVVMGIGMMKIYLKVADGEQASIKDLFLHYKLFFKLIFAQLLAGLISGLAVLPVAFVVGLFFVINNNILWVVGAVLILAGVLFTVHISVRLMFVQYLVVDKGMGPVEAVKGSFAITKGHVLQLLGFGAMSFLVAVLGVLALFVGLFVAIPVIALATVFVYRELSK